MSSDCSLRIKRERQKVTKVKCKRDKSLQQGLSLEYILLKYTSFRRSQNLTIKQIYVWSPMTTRLIMLTLIYVISMESLPLRSTRLSCKTSLAARSQKRGLNSQASRSMLGFTSLWASIFDTWTPCFVVIHFRFLLVVLYLPVPAIVLPGFLVLVYCSWYKTCNLQTDFPSRFE